MLHVESPNLVPRESIPGESPDEQRARELVKRLRKLRWIGEDDLARQVVGELRSMDMRGSALATPPDTD